VFTTYASWRWVFAGEVLIVGVILMLARRVSDTPAEQGVKLDLVGTALSALGLGLVVFGILKSGTWGVVQAKPEAPQSIGLSPVIWLLLGGGVVLALFLRWETFRIGRGEGSLINPKLLRNVQMRSGVISFLFMFLVQAGTFFVVALFLSVALGLSAVETGVRLLPMSLTLLLVAVGVPKLFPEANPRRVVNAGFLLMVSGLVLLVGLLDIGAGPEIITGPLLLVGSGLGALASQLGSVTVSAVPDEQSGEVGGLQNTGTQLGASIGTALAGAILISALTASFFSGIQNNPAIPDNLAVNAQTQLATGVPFVSDKDLQTALDEAHVPKDTADAVVDENAQARITGLRSALALLALISLLALLFTRRIPTVQPGATAQANASSIDAPVAASSAA
jgi:Na+/melibiose symporter-like transporter